MSGTLIVKSREDVINRMRELTQRQEVMLENYKRGLVTTQELLDTALEISVFKDVIISQLLDAAYPPPIRVTPEQEIEQWLDRR